MPEIIAVSYAFVLPVFLYDSDFSAHESSRLYALNGVQETWFYWQAPERSHEVKTKTPVPGWITNNPAIARKLRKADADLDRAKQRAARLPIGAKIAAIRAAKLAHETAYDTAVKSTKETL